jgi:hypothetical protein
MPLPGIYNEKTEKCLALIGLISMRFNFCESILRELLGVYFDESIQFEITITHTGNRSLGDALRTLNNEYGNDETKPHINHFIKWFEIMTEYRNYYVHGPQMEGQLDGEPGLIIHSSTAKSRLKWHQEVATHDKLTEVAKNMDRLLNYGSALLQATSLKMQEFLAKHGEKPSPLPEKPPLPDRLQKQIRFPTDDPPPPQS